VVDKTGDVVATLSASDLRGLTKDTFKNLLLSVLDFLRLASGGLRMTLTTQPQAELGDVIRKLAWSRAHRLWIVKNHKILGVVTLSDIMAKFSPFDFKGTS